MNATYHRELLDAPPPSDVEAEKMALGCILISTTSNDTFAELSDRLSPHDFYDEPNRIVFEQMAQLRRNGQPIDIKLLCDSLKSAGANDVSAFELLGGAAYLARLIQLVPNASHGHYYANIVRERADKRRLLDLGILAVQASHNGKPARDTIETLRESLREFDSRDTATRYRRFTAAELDDADIDIEYLIEDVLAAKHVGGVIGASKLLKTTITADLAFSVATGGRFLGMFNVPRPAVTAFMSGESGLPTLQETFRRIARVAGRNLRDATNLIISDELPQLGNADHMTALCRFIEQDAIELLIIDPLYLCADTAGREGSLFAMGALLRSVAEVVTDCGTTLLILHHMTQTSAKESGGRNPELSDSSWAGTQQFFRQWIALNRRTPYDPEQPGRHELRLVTGGSMGHATGIALDIEEGSRNDPDGRRWDVDIRSLSEVQAENLSTGEAERNLRREAKFNADCELARLKLKSVYPAGVTKNDLRAKCRFSGDRMNAALAELDERGVLETCDVKVGNHKKPHKGIRLRSDSVELFSPE